MTADLHSPAMVKMDITNIQFPDETFDVVYCSHVLEHVPDDRKAMREFYRVLKSNGWAVLLVPIIVEKTFEDPSIDKPKDRLRLFGQSDHVRKYGRDYVDRLRESGFSVSKGDGSSKRRSPNGLDRRKWRNLLLHAQKLAFSVRRI
jgi:ubiquinone/menaquinone biosynthesis C-methylase UbiE